ncbi:type II toxin-antitoxin system VapC family toxin [Brucella intermedia]|uniref:type II toxin-antitoxin system VapC family toxin n=1 Tax=Brucella intermedia TaxID=94625 RepID=UPI000468AED2|nr:type II toxin-antitoxin system VapC family toxin [Brucella intermedia]
MILADTSIWIDHLRRGDNDLVQIIGNDLLLCHPAVIGELALGSLRDRAAVLSFLRAQREIIVATHDEVMSLIERHSVFSMGIGYTDAHLLASVLLDQRTSLWTRDKRLKQVARKAGATLYEPFHS